MFEVSQFDSYSYLFNKPTFISLDPDARPGSHPDQGHAHRRQWRRGACRPGLCATRHDGHRCQLHAGRRASCSSDMGTVMPLEKGPDSDQFFLTFERIG